MSEDKNIRVIIPGKMNRKLILRLLDENMGEKQITKAQLVVQLAEQSLDSICIKLNPELDKKLTFKVMDLKEKGVDTSIEKYIIRLIEIEFKTENR